MLLAEAQAAGVDLRLAHRITGLSKTDSFCVDTENGAFSSASLVLATGGLSIPKLGATGFAYDAARHFGLRATQTRPGLVPLTFGDDLLALMRPLAGASLDAEVTHLRHQFRDAVLFTHRGLSGPAILQISSYWREGPIMLNLLPHVDAAAFLLDRKRRRPKAELHTVLAEQLPQRLAQALAADSGRMADMPDRVLRTLAQQLQAWTVTPTGIEGFAKAEVTAGGIDTRDLSSKTMQSAKVPGLFAIGEAVDVTGWLGGYNFQWAWASGWCAGEAA
jgi:predicted Rossmann fold flavoprotein